MRICSYDIETTGLEAVGCGWVLCAVIKPLGEKPIVYRYDRYKCKLAHETDMVRAIMNKLQEFDLVIGHNSENFDWPYLKSRLVQLDLPYPNRYPLSYDTLKAFKRCGFRTVDNGHGKPTASLKMVVDFFGIEQLKTPILPREHWKTVWAEGKERKLAIDNLVDHCIRDVSNTESVYWRVLEADTKCLIKRLG